MNKNIKIENRKKMRIGIDFGGVLCDLESKENIISMTGAIEALKFLRERGHTLVLVSFCGRKRALETLPVVKPYFDEIYFVKKPTLKQIVCQNRCLNVLIDDRSDIIASITKPTVGILFQNWKETMEVLNSLACASDEKNLKEVDPTMIYI